jgi:HEAT repeat protein
MVNIEPSPNKGESAGLPVLRQQLQDQDPVVRMRAARVFCDQEDPEAIPALVELLRDPCLLVRVSAAYALGRNSHPSTVPTLIEIFEQDWNGYVRKGIVWALGNAQDPRALPVLARAVIEDIAAVRLWAASALGQVGAKVGRVSSLEAAIQALLQGCQRDPVAAVRSNCAWALGQLHGLMGDSRREQVIQILVTVMNSDGDLSVQDDAQQALKKLGADPTSDFF